MGNNLRGAMHEEGAQVTQYDESSMINQGTPDDPQPQLSFHIVHGTNIQLLRSNRVAKRKESFCKGLAFSARPIRVDENVCIRFAEVVANWSGVLRFGVTNIDPSTFREADLPKFACPDLTSREGYWAKALPERYSVEGSILHFYVNVEGELYYGINGIFKGQFLSGINVHLPLWVIVDIYGNTSALEFIDQCEIRQRVRFRTKSRENRSVASSANSAQQSSISVSSQAAPNLALPSSRYHAGVNFLPLTFHTVRGKHISITQNYTVAERYSHEFACGYVFTARPIGFNERIVIQVLEVEMAYSGGLAFGLTCCDPKTVQGSTLPIDSDDLLERPEYWVSIKDVAAKPKATDELSFWITERGEVYFMKNDSAPSIIIHVDTAVKLWAFFDIYGTTMKIRLLGYTKVGQRELQNQLLQSSFNSALRGIHPLSPTYSGGQRRAIAPLSSRGHLATSSSRTQSPQLPSSSVSQSSRNLLDLSTESTSMPRAASNEALLDWTSSNNIVLPSRDRIWRSVAGQLAEGPVHDGTRSTAFPSTDSNQTILARAYTTSLNAPPLPARPQSVIVARNTPVVPARRPQRHSEEENDAADECRICMNAKVNCVIYTCGHMSMCFDCATETWHVNGECPICRKKIEDVIKIFKA